MTGRAVLLARRLRESPVGLALLRIVVPLVILRSPELHDAPALARHPERLAALPEGLGLLARLPLTEGVVRALVVLTVSSAATALLGYRTRLSLGVLTASGLLVFSLSQREGAVLHDMHLFWMTALLAASRAGDAWSLDAWGQPRPGPSIAYGVPLQLARLLLGVVYFFPGVHKLAASGARWMTSANLIGQLHAKWLENHALPLVRIDLHPRLCALGAALVVAFELSFFVLALCRRTRPLALLAGLAFHAATQLLLFIPFMSLWACHVVLLDGAHLERIEGRLRALLGLAPVDRDGAGDRGEGSDPGVAQGEDGEQDKGDARWPRGALAVGGMIAVAAGAQGARGQTQAYPVACYPTFEHIQGGFLPDLVIEWTDQAGVSRRITGREQRRRSQADWGRVFWLSGATGAPPDEGQLRAYARQVAAEAGAERSWQEAARVRVLRVMVPTAPEDWEQAPRGGVILAEWSPR
jgi:hypothetical protein